MTVLTPNRRQVLAGLGSAAMVAGLGRPSLAQSFPTRPVRWICYQAAGGSMDVTMRAYMPFLEKYGVRTQLDYVQGGSGNIARTEVYNARPDGYTIMMEAAPGPVFGEVVTGAPYRALAFEPVFGWSVEGWQLCTSPDGDIKTMADLVRLAGERRLVAASIGRGSTSHLQLLVLQEALGIEFNIVHFTGTGEAYPQVIGRNVDFGIGGPGSGSRARDRLHIFAVFRATGEPALPDVPTLPSMGFTNVPEINQTWYATATPGVPADRLEILTEAFRQGYEDPDFAEAQARAGMVSLVPLMPDEIRASLQAAFDLANQYKDVLSA